MTQIPDDQDDRSNDTDENPLPGKARKERVLHTRVPVVLEDELKRLATSLRMPVSNVVRAILEDAVEAVEVASERAEGELKGIAHRIAGQRDALRRAVQGEPVSRQAESREPPRREPARAATPTPSPTEATPSASSCPASAESLEGVIGFQRLTLAAASSCTVCGKAMPRGAAACRGVRDDAGPRVLLGGTCALLPEEI